MKTISELNERWWYRLVKVVFILSIISCYVVAVVNILDELAPYEVFDFESSTFTCGLGIQKTLAYPELLSKVNSIDLEYEDLTAIDIATICEITGPSGETFSVNNDRILKLTRADYTSFYADSNQEKVTAWKNMVMSSALYNKEFKTIGNWKDVALASLVAFAIIAISFEVSRRIFYYIILGSINPPKKKHESDTILP